VRAKKQAILGLCFTVLLATIFTLLQGMEYIEASFNINDIPRLQHFNDGSEVPKIQRRNTI
jgi:heme/copper-type cytochrome/quinol oxidase subunit 3